MLRRGEKMDKKFSLFLPLFFYRLLLMLTTLVAPPKMAPKKIVRRTLNNLRNRERERETKEEKKRRRNADKDSWLLLLLLLPFFLWVWHSEILATQSAVEEEKEEVGGGGREAGGEEDARIKNCPGKMGPRYILWPLFGSPPSPPPKNVCSASLPSLLAWISSSFFLGKHDSCARSPSPPHPTPIVSTVRSKPMPPLINGSTHAHRHRELFT